MDSLTRRLAALAVPLAVTALTVAGPAHASPSETPEPVLGSPTYMAPYGEGWGTAHPSSVFNGGDPSGSVQHLHWKHWGEDTSTARGKTPIFRPGGGYYARPGRIKFRAESLGTCEDGTYAYTKLEFRVSKVPNGPLGHTWRLWSGSESLCTDD